MITDEVAVEYGDSLPKWITVEPVKDKEKTKIISSGLGIGESSTIALALEQKNALIILDDKKARRLAKEYELSVTGTLGVVVKAKNMGFIVDIQSVLNDFKQYGFWIPYDIEQFLLS
jgi:predicted nucleic acid-binding protein